MSPVGISAITLVGIYLCANLLLTAVAALVAGIRAISRVLPRPMSYRHILVTGRTLAVAALAVLILAVWHGRSELSPLRAQVWAAPSMRVGTVAVSGNARVDVGIKAARASLPVNTAIGVALVAFGSGLLMVLLPALSQVRSTFRSIRNAHALRSVRSVRILVSDKEPVPFAVWIPGRSYIVLPTTLVLRPDDFRMALRHEGQHHRQGDTRYVYLALLGRVLFGFNPAVHWLTRQLNELQELACDEALARRSDHRTDAYCACLLRIAETALSMRESQLRSYMANWHAGTLRRRIEAAVRRPGHFLGAYAATGVGLAAIALLAALSAVIVTPIQDRRVSRVDVEQLVATTPGSATWGLRVNDAVIRELNLLLGTPDGRMFLVASISRMHTYEPGVLAELQRYSLPSELAAVQMFSDLHSRFQDWPLALMAYNVGVSRVEAGISATHSRDAWTISEAGYGNDPDYLAKTAAVMLVLAHPQLLN